MTILRAHALGYNLHKGYGFILHSKCTIVSSAAFVPFGGTAREKSGLDRRVHQVIVIVCH